MALLGSVAYLLLSNTQTNPRRLDGCMIIWLKIALAMALLGCAVWYLKPDELLAAAGQVGRDKVLVCGAIALVGIGVQWIKWQLLLRPQIPEANGRDALYSLLGGAALGLVTPSRLGELGRGVFLGRSRTKAALLTAVDKVSSATVTLGLGAAAAWVLWPHLRGFLLLLVCILGALLYWGWCRRRAGGPIAWPLIAGLSVLFNGVFMAQFLYLVSAGVGTDAAVVLAVPVVFALKTLLPLGFLDLGVREAAAVLVFSSLGLEPQPAFVASLLIFACNVCLPAGLGWLWIGSRRLRTTEKGAL